MTSVLEGPLRRLSGRIREKVGVARRIGEVVEAVALEHPGSLEEAAIVVATKQRFAILAQYDHVTRWLGKLLHAGSQPGRLRHQCGLVTYDYKDPVRPMYWLPEAQTVQWDDPAFASGEIWSHYLYNIVIWAPGNPPGMEERVRKALASVDPNLVLYGVDTYTKVVSADFQQENMIVTLTTLFGVLGLMLAAIGLYGVMAYMVEQRTNEIGVRMALGADRGSVVKMVLRGAFSQVGIGLLLGIPAAIGAGKLMTGQLFGVKPWDPVMLTMATLLLALAALLASLIPARRAAGVQPMVALRNE